ncbi:CdiA C-terminal domain-containing protein [Umezakia ovalisporum]|uniref:CdiA C-terminal domain-containing protein n=1 Tax=Umezakia ovalisporum TaxID=75695 RepID=UPI0035BA25B0
MNFNKRKIAKLLLSLVLTSHTLNIQEQVIASQVVTNEPELRKGLLDIIIGGDKKICFAGICIDPGKLTESLLAKQIREISEKNAPVTVSSDKLFPRVSSLPGNEFNPVLLDLQNSNPQDAIPPGDYAIFVKVYCLQKVAASPNGHRYLLGQYGGKRKEVLAALNLAAANSNIAYQDIQNLSWAIQSGISYESMPQPMQELVNKLIPQHRSSLKEEWWEQVEKIWNQGSRYLNLPSLETFISQNLGDVGRTLLATKQVHQRLVSRGSDWRNLSDIFIINDVTQGTGNILATPWSQLANGVYARFVSEGNAQDTGLLLLRIRDKQSSKELGTGRNKALPLLTILGAALTVYDLYDLVTTLVAVPEGNRNIQPLAMSPELGAITPDWRDTVDVGLELCDRRRIPRGRVSGAINILCSIANGKPRVKKPGVNQSDDIARGRNNTGNDGSGNNNNNQRPDRNPQDTTKPSRTAASKQPGSKPRGTKSEINPQSNKETQRSIKRENESADILADKGYDVEQNPAPLPNGKKPDYKIEGETFDAYSPSSSNTETIRKNISQKIKEGQTERIVLNLEDSNVKVNELESLLNRKPIEGLKEIIVIKDGQVIPLFP